MRQIEALLHPDVFLCFGQETQIVVNSYYKVEKRPRVKENTLQKQGVCRFVQIET